MKYSTDAPFPGTLTDEQPTGPSVDERLAAIISPIVESNGMQAQYHTRRPGEAVERPRLARSPLSYSHIGPTIEIATNGTYTKLNIPGAKDALDRPKRGRIDNFTPKSRRRMMDKLNQVDQTKLAEHKYFTTLTYPAEYPRHRPTWNAHRRAFEKKIRRRYDVQAIVWKLEPQKRLAPHYHLLIFAHEEIDNAEVAQCWHHIAGQEDPKHLSWHRGELGNGNQPCTTKIDFFDGVKTYVAKYCSKDIEGDTLPAWWRGGRFWGGMQQLPITIETVQITPREAFDIRRAMRKLYESRMGKLYKTRGIQGVKLYCKQDTTRRMIEWASQREEQRNETGQDEQPPLAYYRNRAARGIRFTGYGKASPCHVPRKNPYIAMTWAESAEITKQKKRQIDQWARRAEQEYLDRLHYYGLQEITPEDCKTVLEKYGFIGLQQRWEKPGLS